MANESLSDGNKTRDGDFLSADVTEKSLKDSTEQVDKAPVKYFTHDHSFKGRLQSFFVGNSRSRFYSTVFDSVIKLTACLLYIIQVQQDDIKEYECAGLPCGNKSAVPGDYKDEVMVFSSTRINWYLLLWVDRPLWLWILQVAISAVTLVKSLITVYGTYKKSPLEKIVETWFILELIVSVPMMVTVCWPPLQNLFVPFFLNIWLAKVALESLFHDLHLTKQRFQCIAVTMSQQMLILTATLVCLIITTVCGIQHIQRGSQYARLSMFESVWFVIVTFSTVGYGDISPNIWPGQLFMMLMICAAFMFVPRQLEIIASTWIERQKEGGTFSSRQARSTKHVVVCTSTLSAETMMDFLNEFYAHPTLEDHMVVLLSPSELDLTMQVILRDPKWANRVMYIRGSALKDPDLSRCRIKVAEACFILGNRNNRDKEAADQHTILRSWAVKDFAPNCPQYVQIFRPESKLHVKFAEHIVCEDEFKYALLANNCLYPGLSTLVTLLLHTSRGQEGSHASERWQQIYGRHSGNEIYHIELSKSVFFRQYKGWRFTEAAVDSHQRFGVSLVGVEDTCSRDRRLKLNPGQSYILRDSDICFYLSVTEEQYSKVVRDPAARKQAQALKEELNHSGLIRSACRYMVNKTGQLVENIHRPHPDHRTDDMALELQNLNPEDEESDDEYFDDSVFSRSFTDAKLLEPTPTPTIQVIAPDEEEDTSHDPLLGNQNNGTRDSGMELDRQTSDNDGVLNIYSDMGQEGMCTGIPAIAMYIGSKETFCHLEHDRRPDCCLRWGEGCKHCSYKHARDMRWDGQLIILAAERPSRGIYNFIVPLRSHFLQKELLSPIVLLLEHEPDVIFTQCIAQFPMVYWMLGKITVLDDLLRAGINKADHIVIVNRDGRDITSQENTLADSNTIVAVQTIHKLFPSANVITELSQSSNMRFMQFRAMDEYALKISNLERRIKNEGSNLSYMFRLPFAAGNVFSACMLDTLLYQTFVKDYLISFVRLLLGIDRAEGSGHLSSIRVKKQTMATLPTYGRLFHSLVRTTGEIPIAIYRTHRYGKTDDPAEEKVKQTRNGSVRGPSVKTKRRQENMKKEVIKLVKERMNMLHLPTIDYNDSNRNSNEVSFVIVNPYFRRRLKLGDIIYVIQPSSMSAVQPIDNRRRKGRYHSTATSPTQEKVTFYTLHST